MHTTRPCPRYRLHAAQRPRHALRSQVLAGVDEQRHITDALAGKAGGRTASARTPSKAGPAHRKLPENASCQRPLVDYSGIPGCRECAPVRCSTRCAALLCRCGGDQRLLTYPRAAAACRGRGGLSSGTGERPSVLAEYSAMGGCGPRSTPASVSTRGVLRDGRTSAGAPPRARVSRCAIHPRARHTIDVYVCVYTQC